MHQADMEAVMEQVFEECRKLRSQGQGEYAGGPDADAFANFDRVARSLNMPGFDRRHALWTYLVKHFDGVAHYLQGNFSQRENVRGRINDMIVYLCLLRGMVDEMDGKMEEDAWAEKEREKSRIGRGLSRH